MSIIKSIFGNKQGKFEKQEALEMLSINELKGIIAYYGIGNPEDYQDIPLSKDRLKINLTRRHYVDRIISSLSINQIRNYIELKKIGGIK